MKEVAKKITREILNSEALQSKLSKDKICYNLKMFSLLSKNLKYDKKCTKCGVKIDSSNFYIGKTRDTYQIESMCRTHWIEYHNNYKKEMKELNYHAPTKEIIKKKLEETPSWKYPKCYNREVFNILIEKKKALGKIPTCIDCGVKINHKNFYLIPAVETKIGYSIATRCRTHFKENYNNFIKSKKEEKQSNFKKSFNLSLFKKLNVKPKSCNVCGVKITQDNFKLQLVKGKYWIRSTCRECIRAKDREHKRNKYQSKKQEVKILSLKDKFKNFISNLFK